MRKAYGLWLNNNVVYVSNIDGNATPISFREAIIYDDEKGVPIRTVFELIQRQTVCSTDKEFLGVLYMLCYLANYSCCKSISIHDGKYVVVIFDVYYFH